MRTSITYTLWGVKSVNVPSQRDTMLGEPYVPMPTYFRTLLAN